MKFTRSKLDQLIHWVSEFRRKWGQDPQTIPVTRLEFEEIRNMPLCGPPMSFSILNDPPRVFGIEAGITPFAESVRARRLEVGPGQYATQVTVDEAIMATAEAHQFQQQIYGQLIHQLRAYLLTDETEVKIIFERDRWAWLKRLLRVTHWWPVKKATAIIDCKVIYPRVRVRTTSTR